MSKYELIRNVLRLHEIIAESRPGVPLTSTDIALALKLRIVRPVSLSEKQITSGIKFLRDLGYPVEYDETEHRWLYNWDPNKLHPALLEKFACREDAFPKPTFAVLLMLRHGLDALAGTPLWGEVKEFFEKDLEEALWKQTREMGELFSVRPREGAGISKGVFECLAGAVYERGEVELTLKPDAEGETTTLLVEPYHLTLSEGLWYLVARDPSENTLRTIALPQIASASNSGQHFSPPQERLVKRYLREFFGTSVGIGDLE